MISEKLLRKYDLRTLEEFKERYGDGVAEEIGFYKLFLAQTDYIPMKLFEGSLTSADYAEELESREYARMMLSKLNGEEYTPKVSKNIEERTTEAEMISTAMLGTDTNKDQASEQLRRCMQMYAQTLTDEEAMEIATVFPAYEVGKFYKKGTMLTYGENGVGDPQLYRVAQDHTGQANWKPDAEPSLYTPIGLTEEGYPVWSQPSGAHDSYMTGDIVDRSGTLYESLIDGNTYPPEMVVNPPVWKVYTE